MTEPALAARRAGVDLNEGAAAACGTFGELLQGVLPDGTDFLATFPITHGTRAWFRYDRGGPPRVYPANRTKSLGLVRAMLATGDAAGGGTLILDSDLLVGKGLASSSADLVATARAVGGVLGLDVSPSGVEDWLRPIEPTDGVMHPGVVLFDHRRVRLRTRLGSVPPATVVAVDEGGLVDTVAHNRRGRRVSPALAVEYARLADDLTTAVGAQDLAAVGAVATRSAVLNQRWLPKRNLDALIRIAGELGAAGVVCTHSGTMAGLLLDAGDPGHADALTAARAACARLPGTTSVYRSAPVPFGTVPGSTHAL
ncbi:GHMP family kinase ATP-binding protein [Saccharopolyspora endophytica]|uniref:Kinase n=1 Tax=Saccharopolyspora endophytica TaxID=543886 RepID=A0ABS5DLD4_9PSEU|nr:kinase [Saccharopolyspora endophytica]MBQ0927093.1 kinase [Saccharopolyspora endophytica]